MDYHSGIVATLVNSIIGVSILAMPYCFRQTGIFLSIIMLILSNLITRLTCHFLIKSAIISRKRTFEYMAYFICGRIGKFVVEILMIGFLIGTCIAFFVVMGDLGPDFISELTGRDTSNAIRTTILMALAMFFVLPLGLLRNVESLNGVSKVTIGFYFFLVIKIVIEAMPHIFRGDWTSKVEFWRPTGVIQCLPIFSMALSCQSQLFEIYKIVHNPTLEQMNCVVKNAINICTVVYFCVGFFGYIAYAQKNFTGNILMSFEPSIFTNVLKLGFVLSVAFSFPLVIFPCRASVHSMIYRDIHTIHESTSNYIPEGRFKGITLGIIFISLVVGIWIPNIELVLGLIGSTIGITVCVLFPVLCFIYISTKDTNERLLAKLIFVVGFSLMIVSTYENLHRLEKIDSSPIVDNLITEKKELFKIVDPLEKDIKKNEVNPLKDIDKLLNHSKIEPIVKKPTESLDIRHEPPEPFEPQEPEKNIVKEDKKPIVEQVKVEQEKVDVIADEPPKLKAELKNKTKSDEVDIEAIKKDDIEMQLQQENDKKPEDPHLEEHKILLDTIQKQNEVQEEIVKQQKKLIEVIQEQNQQKVNQEKMKAVKEIESIALKAIEKISSDAKENEKIVAKLQEDVIQHVNSKESQRATQKKEVNVENLKIENILLKEKIESNVPPKKISLPNKIVEKNESVIVKSKARNETVKNNTAPLFLNLGQKDIPDKPTMDNNSLPVIIPQANLSKSVDESKPKNTLVKKDEGNLDSESKVMRREILSVQSTENEHSSI